MKTTYSPQESKHTLFSKNKEMQDLKGAFITQMEMMYISVTL